MKKLFLAAIVSLLILTVSVCSAWPNNPSVMEALKANPHNYIYYGYTGPGGSLYLDKTSIGVERYEPPYYIIKFKAISYDVFPSGKYANEHWEKYHYNYDTKEMFRETKNSNGISNLSPINEKKYSKLPANQMWLLNGGELAFYLAYKMNFYGEPISGTLKSYFKNKTWIYFSE